MCTQLLLTQRPVLGDTTNIHGELRWYEGGTKLFLRGKVWGTFIEKMAFGLALEGQQEEKGVGGGPSGTDRLNDSRKLGKHRSLGDGMERSVVGVGLCRS